jgi:hypothetical protein
MASSQPTGVVRNHDAQFSPTQSTAARLVERALSIQITRSRLRDASSPQERGCASSARASPTRVKELAQFGLKASAWFRAGSG